MRRSASRRNLYGAGIAISSLLLVASCGGGDGACTNITFCPAATTASSTTPSSTVTTTTTTSTVAALTLAPSSLTVGNCTTGIPFIFKGGQAPYTVFTSNNFYVPVSAPLRLDATRFYFMADVRYPGNDPATNPTERDNAASTATVTVLDAQSQVATATITTPAPQPSCVPDRPPFEASPESANFRTSEIRVFDLQGGTDPNAVPTVTFADDGVAALVSVESRKVTVQAIATGTASTLMTIAASDGQRTSVVINVLPQP